jgi:hypothetical protein
MIAHRACLDTSALGTVRGPERKSVSLHRASRYVVTDVRNVLNQSYIAEVIDYTFLFCYNGGSSMCCYRSKA